MSLPPTTQIYLFSKAYLTILNIEIIHFLEACLESSIVPYGNILEISGYNFVLTLLTVTMLHGCFARFLNFTKFNLTTVSFLMLHILLIFVEIQTWGTSWSDVTCHNFILKHGTVGEPDSETKQKNRYMTTFSKMWQWYQSSEPRFSRFYKA